eukprot:TRINITY_DN3128_c0_g1_i3.p1 TRINITY_DN3128_c0_g1~~TRINITY_DN3128_c0_g1_i3.p1  ORF type:complete len:304 (-),score=66.51 TRINITY_DN3128_c0_g1_i3:165-1076(-)
MATLPKGMVTIGNLASNLTSTFLKAIFDRFGECKVSEISGGQAILEFTSEDSAKLVVNNLNNTNLFGCNGEQNVRLNLISLNFPVPEPVNRTVVQNPQPIMSAPLVAGATNPGPGTVTNENAFMGNHLTKQFSGNTVQTVPQSVGVPFTDLTNMTQVQQPSAIPNFSVSTFNTPTPIFSLPQPSLNTTTKTPRPLLATLDGEMNECDKVIKLVNLYKTNRIRDDDKPVQIYDSWEEMVESLAKQPKADKLNLIIEEETENMYLDPRSLTIDRLRSAAKKRNLDSNGSKTSLIYNLDRYNTQLA